MTSILICMHHRANPNQPSCMARGSAHVKTTQSQAIKDQGLPICVEEIQCLGQCERGPNLRLIPGGPVFNQVQVEQVESILQAASTFLPKT